MTLGLPWRAGQVAEATVTTTGGPWPVHAVSFDIPNDGQPAWTFVVPDARGTHPYLVGPLVGTGNRLLTTTLRDEQGCEASLTQAVTVTP